MPFQFTDKMKLCNQLYFGEKLSETAENTPGSQQTVPGTYSAQL